jgi:hypothetical protein
VPDEYSTPYSPPFPLNCLRSSVSAPLLDPSALDAKPAHRITTYLLEGDFDIMTFHGEPVLGKE